MNPADAKAQSESISADMGGYWKPKEGQNPVRILDYQSSVVGRLLVGKYVKVHPLEKVWKGLGYPTCAGEGCPVCQIPGVERWSSFQCNIVDRNVPDGKVKIARLSPKTGRDILELIQAGLDVGSHDHGRDIVIVKRVQSGNTQYSVIPIDPTPLAPTPELAKGYIAQVKDLDVENAPNMEELQAAANAIQSGQPVQAAQPSAVAATAAPTVQVAVGTGAKKDYSGECLGQFDPKKDKCGDCTAEMRCFKLTHSKTDAKLAEATTTKPA